MLHVDAMCGMSAAPGPLFRVSVSTDADDHASSLTAWKQSYDQVARGRFCGTLREFWPEKRLQIFEETTSHALRQRCEVWDGAYWFGIPAGEGMSGRIGESVIEGEAIVVRPGGLPFQLQTPSLFRIFGIVIEREMLQRYIADTAGVDLHATLFERQILNADASSYSMLKNTLQGIFTAPHLLSHHEHARQSLQQVLLHALSMHCLSRLDLPKISLTYVGRHRLVQRACEQANDRADGPLSIQELCRALRVSRRTLQYAFEDVCGISPGSYLRILRLNSARRALRDPDHAFTDVQDIAAQAGFWHASQFASDYKRFFGEKPSETLRRRIAR